MNASSSTEEEIDCLDWVSGRTQLGVVEGFLLDE